MPRLVYTILIDDLGRSGSGVSRPGFERLLAAICEGRVGAVFAIEASRLARNGRDWHTLIEFCGLVTGSNQTWPWTNTRWSSASIRPRRGAFITMLAD